MVNVSLVDIAHRLRETQSLDDVMAVMVSVFECLGFSDWVYACQMMQTYVTAPVFVFMNTSQAWIERYLEMGYHEVDPVAKYYINNNLPWIWDVKDDWTAMGPNVVEFMNDIASYGYQGGVCIPLFSAQNTRGFINFATRNPSLEDVYESLDGRAGQAVLILRYVQEEIFRIAMTTVTNIYQNPLSTRQKEVLLWIGEGLTSKGVAEKLGLSHRTVESYLEEIQKKLKVANRQQAVTRAVSLGYIIPLNTYKAPKDKAVRLVLPF